MTAIFKKAIPRRTFLRGAGATLALPLLDSMIPALAAASAPTVRVGYIYLPLGRIMSKWTPATEGPGFEMTPTLAPLTPFRDQLTVISGLNIKAADPRLNEGGGNHARPCATYLTGIHPGARTAAAGISVDQIIAAEFGKHTQLASLELGMDPAEFVGEADGTYAGYYRSTVSWRSGTVPLLTEDNPRRVFERMFGDTDTTNPAERIRRISRQRSILDAVMGRVNHLMTTVGPSDGQKITEYLDAVRDVERRIQVAETTASVSGEPPAMERPAGIPATYAEHARLMFDLMLLAYQTDLTRVITFMMGHEGTNRPYREIGAHDGHHSLSHHKDDPGTVAIVEKIDLYHSQLVAGFLEKLRATPDAGGSLLDHSIFVCGSALGNANLHLHNDIPIALVGGGAGKLKGGRHLVYRGLPLSNLHLTTLDMLGVPDTAFLIPHDSDATGRLEGIV
ncbi:MAG: DUF1552 domain-containing protein [Acidobacteria bacterium]|nr:DUF1552 domain-containing protein [Acidobacteriota bacterium]